MITEEQIKNLKSGDIIYLNNYPLTFKDSNMLGYVFANDNLAECCEGCACWFSNKYLSLTSAETATKYDPCRLFKEGDRVKPRKLFGRHYSKAAARIIDKICTVLYDEIEHYTVSIRWDEGECNIDPAYLELVTPVEERVSFRVGDFPVDGEWSVWKNSFGKTEIISSYKIDTHPNAKAAAEAECARLNADYRKEVEK